MKGEGGGEKWSTRLMVEMRTRRQLFFDASQIDSSYELVSDICKS